MNPAKTHHPLVNLLLEECPFLELQLDPDDFDLPTIVFGDVAGVLKSRLLSESDDARLWQFLNRACESGIQTTLDIIGTGTIELFNDNADSQGLARAKLNGAALRLLEEFRVFWGQPDYDR